MHDKNDEHSVSPSEDRMTAALWVNVSAIQYDSGFSACLFRFFP